VPHPFALFAKGWDSKSRRPWDFDHDTSGQISVITKSELLFGVEVSPRRRQGAAALGAFLNYIQILDFPDEASPLYARIRADLRRLGSMIGANDLFIAAHARSLGLTLVTNNTREFGRVSRLVIENWTLGS
jgi:tRNA(fMet)-specific endonuclease VapC